MKNYTSIDDYIKAMPENHRRLLEKVRKTVKWAAPKATEKISYGIPTFYFRGNLVHFAIFKNHFGFFPTSSAIKAFQKELAAYDTSKGAIRFPLDKPLPLELIRAIAQYRYKENQNKVKG